MKWPWILLALAALAFLSTGLYIVGPDEEAVVRRFGRVLPDVRAPGLHFGLPWGLDRVDRIRRKETKQTVIGPYLTADALGTGAANPSRAEFLTGDQNLINIRATVHYQINSPADYLFRTAQVEALVQAAAEAALTDAVATSGVDFILTEGRPQLAAHAARRAQESLDNFYRVGVEILQINIDEAKAPPEVADAFDRVQNARNDRDRIIHEEEGRYNQTVAVAAGEARETLDQAHAYDNSTVKRAEGAATGFEALRIEYTKAKQVTSLRLYLESMEDILPRLRGRLLIDSGGTPIDLSILRSEKQ